MLEAVVILAVMAIVIAATLVAVSIASVAGAKPSASDLRALSVNPDEALIDYRTCNALLSDAEPKTSLFGSDNRARTPTALLALASFVAGGLWVGGRAFLTTHRLVFEPNALNRAVHSKLEPVDVDLRAVAAVTHRLGLVTSIVDVITVERTLSIRAYNARAFAENIRAAARDKGAAM